MHYEIAIEPKALVEDSFMFKYISEKCGFHKGLLISEFPKKWKKMVYEASSHLSPMNQKLVSQFLQNKKVLIKSQREYDSEMTWHENVELTDKSKPFHIVITLNNPNQNNKFLTTKSLREEDSSALIVPHEIDINKTTNEYVKVSSLLLSNSKEILFIDPFFYEENHFKPLMEMLNFVDTNAKIKYFTAATPKGETLENRITKLEQNLSRFIPTGIQLEILLIGKSDFFRLHNRFIITEKGGIKFPDGLGEHISATDTINIMEEKTRKSKHNEFMNIDENLISETITITGKKTII